MFLALLSTPSGFVQHFSLSGVPSRFTPHRELAYTLSVDAAERIAPRFGATVVLVHSVSRLPVVSAPLTDAFGTCSDPDALGVELGARVVDLLDDESAGVPSDAVQAITSRFTPRV